MRHNNDIDLLSEIRKTGIKTKKGDKEFKMSELDTRKKKLIEEQKNIE